MLQLPNALPLLTWATLGLELLFLPLSLQRHTRLLVWLAMSSLHIGLLLLVDFADLSIGMLMVHLFTFDRAWIPAKREMREPKALLVRIAR